MSPAPGRDRVRLAMEQLRGKALPGGAQGEFGGFHSHGGFRNWGYPMENPTKADEL